MTSLGWSPAAPGHVPGAHTRAGNAMNRTRAGLLRGAAVAFAEAGLRRSTMQSVAAAAGVSKATLYNHFRTKDEVARALLAAELRRLATVAAEVTPEAALAALADEVATHPVLRRLAAVEPELLAGLLGAEPQRWAEVAEVLAGALGTDAEVAEVVARWLAGLVLQPADPAGRARQAARLAPLLTGGGAPA
ncbi:TetR family transcriptional regulator [Blastococcus sp. SYSU D00820]